MNQVEHFEQITKEMSSLYAKKNADYGDSFSKSLDKYGIIAALTRISDKFNRLESLIVNKNNQVKDERLEDTLMDMASYCIMTKMWVDDISSNKTTTTV